MLGSAARTAAVVATTQMTRQGPGAKKSLRELDVAGAADHPPCMTTVQHASLRNIAVLAGLLGHATLAAAQAPMMDHQLASAVWFDAQLPRFSSGGPSSVLLMNPGLRVALTKGGTLALVTEVPIMSATPPPGLLGGSSRSTVIGNPYLGARITQGPRWYDFGVRLPFARANAASGNYPDTAGIFGDFDRHEAYVPDLTAVSAGLTQSSFAPRGFGTRFSLNGNVDIPVRSRSGQRTDFYANADVLVGYVDPRLAVLAGVTINARLNNSQNAYGEAVSEQLVVGTILRFSRYVRPTLGLRVPLSSDLSRLVKIVYQAGVTIGAP